MPTTQLSGGEKQPKPRSRQKNRGRFGIEVVGTSAGAAAHRRARSLAANIVIALVLGGVEMEEKPNPPLNFWSRFHHS